MVALAGRDFEIRFDQEALRRVEQAVAGLGPVAMRRIIPPSLNRSIGYLRTRMNREIRTQLPVKQKVGAINRWIEMDYATGIKWQARAEIGSMLEAVRVASRLALAGGEKGTGC